MIRRIRTCILHIVVIALASGLSAYSAAETYYRWVDERGDPVHSDRPPAKGVDYEVVSTGSTLKRPVEGNTGAVPRDLQPTPRNDFEPVDTRSPMVEKNPEQCARARENLSALDAYARIRVRNDQGELEYISEEEKEAQREKALSVIEKHCE